MLSADTSVDGGRRLMPLRLEFAGFATENEYLAFARSRGPLGVHVLPADMMIPSKDSGVDFTEGDHLPGLETVLAIFKLLWSTVGDGQMVDSAEGDAWLRGPFVQAGHDLFEVSDFVNRDIEF
ncbi:hypothetical protein U7230_10920 [Carboxydochorda subterranea]|uniref:Uncharacterized protein n=1 Tax=Carboxydichorda subterranea TaxID=3109565 RepID=A0ABZ1BUX4_9FIRM|nr:hypothetical protein [Limnochorda sp. L945t]WRP16600.1 hypothetical protein U7230_10920 [Limnochorda sp. L945t]